MLWKTRIMLLEVSAAVFFFSVNAVFVFPFENQYTYLLHAFAAWNQSLARFDWL